VGYNDCLTRRYFWPYIGYYLNIFLNAADKTNVILPEQVIIIFDPKITEHTRLPNYIDNTISLDSDELLIFKRKLNESIKIFYIKNIIIPINQDCIINDILISIMKNSIDGGGIVSFLNEIKAFHDIDINKIHPFERIEEFCFDFSDKAIFLNWIPTFKINVRSIIKLNEHISDIYFSNEHIRHMRNVVLLSTQFGDKIFNDYLHYYKLVYEFWQLSDFPIHKTEPFSYLDMHPTISDIYKIQKIPNINEVDEVFSWKLSNDINMYDQVFGAYIYSI